MAARTRTMSARVATVAWLALPLLLLGTAAQAKLRVVASVGDLAALTREVGGEQVDVEVLAKPSQDPHFVDARPNLVLSLSRADLLVFVGMELETGWLPTLVTASRNARIQPGAQGSLDASTLITPLEVPVAKVDRSMGDIHPGGNPHYTKDPRNGLRAARGIAERLAQLDQAHADTYRQNLQRLEQSLGARIAEWEKALAPYKGQPVVTFHKSWVYFTEWAGLPAVAFIEPKPGLPPKAAHVAKVMGVIQARKVPLLLQEAWYPAATSELLASRTGARLVVTPGMTPEGKRYADHVGALVDAVVKGLAVAVPTR